MKHLLCYFQVLLVLLKDTKIIRSQKKTDIKIILGEYFFKKFKTS